MLSAMRISTVSQSRMIASLLLIATMYAPSGMSSPMGTFPMTLVFSFVTLNVARPMPMVSNDS